MSWYIELDIHYVTNNSFKLISMDQKCYISIQIS